MEPMWHKYQNFSQQLQFLTECNCNYIINFCVKRKISITYVKVHTCERLKKRNFVHAADAVCSNIKMLVTNCNFKKI